MPKVADRKLAALEPKTIFESEYQKLNDAQKQAVDTIEGPVMVIAGPGTGKTQTLGMRVANILKKTQMRPSNILCLTFSLSGATAMRDRLRLLIGADAYGVTVQTIHGFCQSVIDQHPMVFEEFSMKEQLSDLAKYREMNAIIDALLPNTSLINPKDPYSRDGDILSRISQVKREGKTVGDLEKALEAFDSEMSTKSKEGTKAHEKNLLAVKKFADFIEIFKRYQAMLETTGRYDYDDMILFVLKALREEDWLLASLQERYQYILVDEFQDTNGAQWGLIDRLTSYDALPHEPNLFVVGDDDQAIYRFQGANLQNMLSFHTRFPNAPIIPLTVSYRSTQAILDAARSVIDRNEERLVGRIPGLEKLLTAASGEQGNPPQLLLAASDTAEPWLIADLIEDRLKAGIPSEEIAVLTQTNHELFPLYEVLRSRNIPVVLLGKADLLNHPLVAQALTILSAANFIRSDGLLSAALGCDCFAIHPADLGRIASMARERKESVMDVLLSLDHDAEFPLINRASVLAGRDTLLSISQKVASRTVLETVEHTLRDSGLLGTTEQSHDPLDLAAVEAFFSFVRSRCLERPSYSFKDFMIDLNFYADPEYGQVRLSYSLPHLVTEGVQLMTAHQSKGKEFEVVILTNFRDGHWDKRRNHSGVSLPEDLLFGWGKDQKSFEQHQDERRVAFVAMTRAKRELIFVCPKELTVGEKSKAVSPSAFFAEAGSLPESQGTLRDPEAASLLLHPIARLIDAEFEAYIRHRLESFQLSATALNRFLRDPQEFLFVDLLEQPQHFDEGTIRSLGYGNAVHWALREWAVSKQKGEDFGIDDLLKAFTWHLAEKSILTDKQREDLTAFGSEALPRYFEQVLADAHPVIYGVERDYRARLGDIPLKGKIDRIDLLSENSGIATVIDYKTGAPKTESQIREGDYFRQLAFYSVLLEQGDPLLQPAAYVLDFIGERGEHPIQRSFTVSEAEKEEVRQLIKQVWAKVQALDFSPLEAKKSEA